MEPLLLTVPQAAGLLGISRSKVYELVYHGELRSIQIGRARRIPRDALYEYIGSEPSPAAPHPQVTAPKETTPRSPAEAVAWVRNRRLVIAVDKLKKKLLGLRSHSMLLAGNSVSRSLGHRLAGKA